MDDQTNSGSENSVQPEIDQTQLLQATDLSAYNNPELRADNKKPINKKKLVIAGVLSLFVMSIFFVAFYFVIPSRQSAAYIEMSQPIMDELNKEVSALYKNNFSQALNSVSFAEAKKKLAEHRFDLDKTSKKTEELKEKYSSLQPSRFDSENDLASLAKFDLAIKIQDDYKNSLDLRAQVMDAYGNMPDNIGDYVDLYNAGGNQDEFLRATNIVIFDAADAILKIKKIKDVGSDDQAYYEFRLAYAQYTYDTFKELNKNYEDVNVAKINSGILAFSDETQKRNDEFDKIMKDYVEKSSIAKDFKEFGIE